MKRKQWYYLLYSRHWLAQNPFHQRTSSFVIMHKVSRLLILIDTFDNKLWSWLPVRSEPHPTPGKKPNVACHHDNPSRSPWGDLCARWTTNDSNGEFVLLSLNFSPSQTTTMSGRCEKAAKVSSTGNGVKKTRRTSTTSANELVGTRGSLRQRLSHSASALENGFHTDKYKTKHSAWTPVLNPAFNNQVMSVQFRGLVTS